MANQVEMLRVLLQEADLDFNSLKTAGGAISARLASDKMVDRVVELAKLSGWIVSRNAQGHIALEPEQRTAEPLLTGTKLYHVSDTPKRASILKAGLEPRGGGNTSLNRSYPPRVHLAVKLRDAFQFIHCQISRYPNMLNSIPTSEWRPRKLEELDLFEVTAVAKASYFNDDHFDGRGLWTETLIPASNLILLRPSDWHPLYEQMYPEDFSAGDYWKALQANGN